ncbi:diguanylate cyclase [Paenibacillus validus]|uniref:sensor domain-containing diguanylate cyclase n=1 Tax=Paenibacillus validus TaxID=44253 RepID=UPI000FD6E202|nr:sensor domain-containing diguanylate cyclase [Paenibacillus validus]MED4599376.1 diguanylate cyclase [Paenibacillus validus]MED4606312.1 diguanylate cyclase [Paenibacillus validus]
MLDALLRTCRLNSLIIESLSEPAVFINKQGAIHFVNQSWINFPIHSGEKLDAYLGIRYLNLYDGDDDLKQGIARVMSGLPSYKHEFAVQINEDKQYFLMKATPIEDHGTGILGVFMIYFNITNQKKLEQMLRKKEEQYRLIEEHSQDMIKITDIHGKIEYVSPSHQHHTGHCNDEFDIFHYLHEDDVIKLKETYREMIQTKDSYVLEIRNKIRNGQWVWYEAACSPILSDEGEVHQILIVSRDITVRKQTMQELEFMAYHDYLTGLYNRRKIKLILDETLEEAVRQNEDFALLIMDIDQFKTINDTYGHDVGDMVLKEFSNRLLNCKREGDFVGRLSGDEFTVIMKNIHGKQEITAFIHLFLQSLGDPFPVPDLNDGIIVNSSIGYSIYSEHGTNMMKLFKHADIALYKAKKKSKKGRGKSALLNRQI